MVVPRVLLSCRYITSELEEIEREDNFRLKRFKELKIKKNAAKEGKKKKAGEEECICKPPLPLAKPPSKVEETESRITTTTEKSTASSILIYTEAVSNLEQYLSNLVALGKDYIAAGIQNIDLDEFLNMCEEAIAKLDQFLEEETCQKPGEKLLKRLEHLKFHLCGLIDVTKQFKNKSPKGGTCVCTDKENDKKLSGNDVENKVIETEHTEDTDGNVFEKLAVNIDSLLKILEEYKEQNLLTPSVKTFMDSCYSFKSKCKSDIERQKLDHLKKHITVIEKIMSNMKNQEETSKNADNFTIACEEFKEKLQKLKVHGAENPSDDVINNLIEHIDEGIKLGKEAKEEGLRDESIEEFINTIELFKEKITIKSDKDIDMSSDPNDIGTYIEETMNMISKMLTERCEGKNEENMLKNECTSGSKTPCCEQPKRSDESEKVLCDSCKSVSQKNQLDSTVKEMQSVNKTCTEKLVESENKDICKLCKAQKKKLDPETKPIRRVNVPIEQKSEELEDKGVCLLSKAGPLKKSDVKASTTVEISPCEESDTTKDKYFCKSCKALAENKGSGAGSNIVPRVKLVSSEKSEENKDIAPCNSCKETTKKTIDVEHICKVCSTSEASKSQETYCEFCNKRVDAGEIGANVTMKKKEKVAGQTEDNLGYFEKVTRKKIKLTRTQKKDGTVCEEKETIIIKSEKHGVDAALNDDDTYIDISESLLDDDEKQVAVCTISNGNLRGLIGRTQSDKGVKTSPIPDPVLRQCISFDTFVSCSLYSTSSSLNNEDIFYTQQ